MTMLLQEIRIQCNNISAQQQYKNTDKNITSY